MSFSDTTPTPTADYAQQIDATLAVLASVQPRDGLGQRVLAHLASAPELSWYQRWIAVPLGQHRWAVTAASAAIVAGGIGITAYSHHPAPAPAPVAIHLPRPAQQPAAAAASIGVNQHPLETKKAKHHRGVHRGFRAMHERVPLPRGTAAPLRPQTIPLNQ